MAKKALLLLVVLFLTSHLFSQVKPFRFGLKIAPNIGWFSPDSDGYERDGADAGFSWGFISDIALTENYHVGTGFNMNFLNGSISYPASVTEIDTGDTTTYSGIMNSKLKFRYIDLPLTLKMKTNKFDELQVYGQIGFSLGFRLKAKADEAFTASETTYAYTKDDHDISEDVTLLKGSLILGGGIEYFLDNSTSIVVGITYYSGISNILKGYNTLDPSIKQKGTPQFIELTLGVIF
jgi:hypothetical protein